MKLPAFWGRPNLSASSPRLVGTRRAGRRYNTGTIALTCALLFTVGGIAYTMRWNAVRQEKGVCIDCARQKEIFEEIYGDKKQPVVQKGYRL